MELMIDESAEESINLQDDGQGADMFAEETKVEEKASDQDETVELPVFADEAKTEESEPETPLIKKLRHQIREESKRRKELESRLSLEGQDKNTLIKPKLADFDFDEEKHEAAMEDYLLKKNKVDEAAKAKAREQDEMNQSWREKASRYEQVKTSSKLPGFADVEASVMDNLTEVQRAIIIDCAESPERLIYALGKSEKRIKELSTLKNPAHFAAAVGRLESQLTTNKTPTNKPPPPESRVDGGTPKNISGLAKYDKWGAKFS